MTKEEFYKLATQSKEIRIESIFKLTIRYYGEETKCYRKKPNSDEWFYKLFKISGFYSTKEMAKDTLKSFINPEDKIHSATIERIGINSPIGTSNVLEWWLYDFEGKEIDTSVCTNLLKEYMNPCDVYFGRTPKQVRFKKGDIVEIIKNDRVYLEVLSELPPTIEEMWGRYKNLINDKNMFKENKFNSEYFENCFSDSYCYLQSDGYHADITPLLLMNPIFPIPEKAEKILTSRYNLMKV